MPSPISRRFVLGLGAGLGVAALPGCVASDAGSTSGTPSSYVTRTGSSSATVLGAASPSPAAPSDSAPVEVAAGTRSRPEVALTFHGAGDVATAEQVLRAAEQAGAHLTVLAVGTWLEGHPNMARRITDAGHELGNHTWSHPSLGTLPSSRIREEIGRCRDLQVKLTGSPGAYFRPSAGQHATPEVLRLAGDAGYHTVLSYDVDSRDWTSPGSSAVRMNVTNAVQPGSIVSLHFGHPETAAAMPGILTDLMARGISAVTASTLLRP